MALGGTLNVQNTGVLTIASPPSDIRVANSNGAYTLRLPQSLHASATPTFRGVRLTALPLLRSQYLIFADGFGRFTRYPAANYESYLVSRIGSQFWRIGGNVGVTSYIGTNDSRPFSIHVYNGLPLTSGGGRVMHFEARPQSPVIIGGFKTNSIVGGVNGAVIVGGGADRRSNSIGTGGDYSSIGGGTSNSLSTGYSVIGGGLQNRIRAGNGYHLIAGGRSNAIQSSESIDYSSIGGGSNNLVNAAYTVIGGGGQNVVGTGSHYAVISGGGRHQVSESTLNATIGGGWTNTVGAGAYGATIAGGENNRIDSASRQSTIGGGLRNSIAISSPLAVIGGGSNNTVDTGAAYSVISGGLSNRIWQRSTTSVIAGGAKNRIDTASGISTISGGSNNSIAHTSGRSTIGGGERNSIGFISSFSGIAGGYINTIGDRSGISTIGGGSHNIIQDSSIGSTIAGGSYNRIGGRGSVIVGGTSLNLQGAYSFGFNGGSFFQPLTIQESDVAVFNNTDLLLVNNDGRASALRFYEANSDTGTLANTVHYSSFKAGTQTANIEYTLPVTAPATDGQVLSATTTGVMSWVSGPTGAQSFANNSTTVPTLELVNQAAGGTALEITDGRMVLSNASYTAAAAGAPTIADDVVVAIVNSAAAAGDDVVAPTGSIAGQLLHVINTSGFSIDVTGLAAGGAHTIADDEGATFIYSGAAWVVLP